jgi:hypothetical protein
MDYGVWQIRDTDSHVKELGPHAQLTRDGPKCVQFCNKAGKITSSLVYTRYQQSRDWSRPTRSIGSESLGWVETERKSAVEAIESAGEEAYCLEGPIRWRGGGGDV